MFTKPDVRHPTCCDMLRVGLILGAVKYGFTAVKRLLQTKNWMEAKEKEVLSSREVRGKEQQMIRLERMTGKKRRGRNNTGKGSRLSLLRPFRSFCSGLYSFFVFSLRVDLY